jgi:glycosidase
MPDLNYNNPAVTTDIQEVIRFWLEDVGVDGFRLDAIKHLIEDGSDQENTPATHDWWDGFYDYYTDIKSDAFTVGEAWTSTDEVVKYIGDEMNIAFEFDTSVAILNSASSETNRYIQNAHQLILENYPPHQFATFLTNHDQARVMSEFRNKDGQAKTAASLLLTGPGVPFLYYGEEIGQKGYKPDENIRTPMQWNWEANAGFTTAIRSWQLPQDNYTERNVAVQLEDSDSLLRHYLTLIQIRNQNPSLQKGGWLELPTSDRRIYAFLRYTEDQNLLVLINMSKDQIQDYIFCLSDGPFTTGSVKEITQDYELITPVINNSGGFNAYKPITELKPYSTYIIEIE